MDLEHLPGHNDHDNRKEAESRVHTEQAWMPIRKIKCDETRPQCKKCTSTGRQCGGYELSPVPSARSTSSRQLLPHRSQSGDDCPPEKAWTAAPNIHMRISWTAAPDIRMTAYEKQAFDYFRFDCYHSLYRNSPGREWVRAAMQFATEEPAVFYATTAFAAAQKGVALTTHHVLRPPLAVCEKEGALLQFYKATSSLQRYIDDAITHNARIEPILLCCILFVGFEMMQNKEANAISHLRLGRRIIEGRFKHNGSPGSRYEALDPELGDVAMELIATWDPDGSYTVDVSGLGTSLDQDNPETSLGRVVDLPLTFSSGEQARNCLESLLEAGVAARNELTRLAGAGIHATDRETFSPAVQDCVTHCLSKTVYTPNCHRLQCQIRDLANGHDSWLTAVATMEATQHSALPEQMALLKLRHLFSSLNLRMCLESREANWDCYTGEIVQIMQLTQLILHGLQNTDADSTTNQKMLPKSYSLESGVLPALALVAFKCRSNDVRWRAIRLLRTCNRQEGLQSGESIAYFVETIVALEEARARSLQAHSSIPSESAKLAQPPNVLPEAARFADVIVSGETPERTRIVCGRFANERNGELELIEYMGMGYPMLFEQVNTTVTRYRCWLQ